MRAWNSNDLLNPHVFLERCQGGTPLPRALRRYVERLLGTDLEDIRVLCSARVELLGVAAVAVGERIVLHPSVSAGFNDEHTTHLLVHELTHVAQQKALRVPFRNGIVFDGALETEAELIADTAVRELAFSNPERYPPQLQVRAQPGWQQRIALQPHPAERVLRFALTWLGRRETKALTKHIQNHTRRIFLKPLHGVFRNINKIRGLVQKTLEEGVQLTRDFATHSGVEAIERNGVKITRQRTKTPGKIRYVLEKTFNTPIGTKGEKVLRVVIDMTGRLVTAFPVDKLLAILLTATAIDLFTDAVSEAAEQVAVRTQQLAELEEKRNEFKIDDLIPLIGDSDPAGANEDLELAYDRWIDSVVKDIVNQFGNPELEDIVRIAIGLPGLLDDDEDNE
jgi:hypothetical protein